MTIWTGCVYMLVYLRFVLIYFLIPPLWNYLLTLFFILFMKEFYIFQVFVFSQCVFGSNKQAFFYKSEMTLRTSHFSWNIICNIKTVLFMFPYNYWYNNMNLLSNSIDKNLLLYCLIFIAIYY